MPVRSRRFFGPTSIASASSALLYTVPADRTARFSLVTVVQTGAPTAGTTAIRLGSATGFALWIGTGFPSPFAMAILVGMVLDPGDQLWGVAATGAPISVAGFGSLLDGAPA